jgi:metal-responsive CopG/Arc/MetJ family transcriptional regulator
MRRYDYLVRVKTSVTLPDDLLRQIDRQNPNRSAFIEMAARRYLREAEKVRRRKNDAAIMDKIADRLNKEAADVLGYQTLPE